MSDNTWTSNIFFTANIVYSTDAAGNPITTFSTSI